MLLVSYYPLANEVTKGYSNATVRPGVEFKQTFQLASRTSRYKNQLAPQIFY